MSFIKDWQLELRVFDLTVKLSNDESSHYLLVTNYEPKAGYRNQSEARLSTALNSLN